MDCDFELTFREGKDGFPDLLVAIEDSLDRSGVPADVAMQMMVVFDEVISNILNHGASSENPVVTVRIRCGKGVVNAEVLDNGVAFDPLSLATPDTSLSIEDRPIGGLGIHIVRELMDSIEYRRVENCNLLRFAKNYPLA